MLEVLQSNVQGKTLRTFEAIGYNKILITNNKTITGDPLYNKDYIYLLDDIYSFDFELIKIDKRVEYKKLGMSPVLTLEAISKQLFSENII